MIKYTDSLHRFSPEQFDGFCVGWKKPLTSAKLFEVLNASYKVVIAYDMESFKPVGFVYAISDGLLSAYIPLLEVKPEYQHQKIGTELMKLMLEQLENFYMVDLCTDSKLEKFYQPFGFTSISGMVIRNADVL
jgi:predicted N-acetyltransferase YhbS